MYVSFLGSFLCLYSCIFYQPSSPGSTYDDQPNPEFPAKVISPRTSPLNIRTSGRASEGPIDSGYGGSVSGRRPSEDRRRPSEVDFSSRRSEDTYAPGRSSQDTYTGSISSRRRPSVDTTRKSDERERGDRRAPSVSGTSDSASTAAQSTTATSGMIVPIKSTIAEEEIQVPYGREARDSGSTMMEEDGDRSRDRSRDPLTDAEPDSASEYLSPRSPLVGLSGLSARLKDVDDEDDDGPMSPQGRSGDEYYDKYGRSSVQSDRSGGATGIGARMMRASAGGGDDQEKMRRDYEFKIATMQTQISTLQRDLGDTEERERKWNEGEVRVRQMEEELLDLRRVSACLFSDVVEYSMFFISEPKNRVLRCWHCRRNSMTLEKHDLGRRNERLAELKRTKRNFKSFVVDVRPWRKKESMGVPECVSAVLMSLLIFTRPTG